MESFVRRFIRSSLIWLAVGILIGLGMSYRPALIAIRPAHVHANLLGFVSMMIFGVAYHVLPRFLGVPLYSRRLPTIQLWAANLGLALMVTGFIGRGLGSAPFDLLIRVGAVVSTVAAGLFIYTVWRTLDAAGARPGMPGSAGRG